MADQPPPSSGSGDPAKDYPEFRPNPDSARWSPQQKKQFSYDKDRRNTYGENDKGSRRAIRRHKREVNRANRHRDRQVILGSTGVRRPDGEDITDDRLHGRRRKSWRKSPDETLRRVVERKLRRRREKG